MAETEYYTAMDMYPQQYEDSTRMYKFYDYLREGRLTTTKCKDCGKVHWPPRLICPECISENLEWIDLPKKGRIYSYTAVYAGLPPDLADKAPVIFALIDFDIGIRMTSNVVDCKPEEVRTGLEVELTVAEIPPDYKGRKRIIPYFKLVK